MSERFDDDSKEAAAASNAGVVLTSTLWHQRGYVYICVDGVQQKIAENTYHQFCPLDENGSRSRTGCSNTADGQILYYWVEKGYDLQLEVTTDNYFYIGSKDNKYHVSETANSGEGTLSQINAILASPDRIGNGYFIAALNFFCGVNNHSIYKSDTTSTSWSYVVSHTGKGTAAFAAAGFDSHYFIARKASGSVPKLFFSGDTELTELGLSILRENLDYGEPIRIGVPSHAIYMDGYRLNSETEEYEYHLNYGWGTTSTTTRWYTESELNNLTIGYVAIDLSPDVTARVSNARSDYYGGSFTRGLERINHIVNDKSTTFDFDAELAGETIALDAVARITSSVDVAFRNIAVSLATTESGLFESARGMSFDISGGSLIVDAAGTPYAIRETGNSAVNVTVNDGFIYSGNAEGGISAVQDALRSDSGYSSGDFDADFYASVGGYAVKSGGAADTVTLKRGAALFGKLDLGAGDNHLNIGAGSLFYGAFAGAADTLTVDLTIDTAAKAGATISLADADSWSAFYAATGGLLNVDLAAPGPRSAYELLHGVDGDLARMFSVNLTVGDGTAELGTLAFGEKIVSGSRAYSLEFASDALELAVESLTRGDLNGDGRADVIMSIVRTGHGAEGATGAWLIQSDQTAAWDDLSTRNADWEIFGTGVSDTGKPTNDIYVKSTGNVIGAWVTDDSGKVAGWQTVGEFDANTQVLGLGDFNGDGQTDLLLRNTNGAVGCYLTDGTGWNYFQSLGDEWSICGIGDFNGDGRDDVVLKHDAGFAGSWLTQTDGTMAWADLDTLPEGFGIVGAGDFDGDGTSDVLLKNGNYYGAWIVLNGNAKSWMGLGDLGSVTVEQIGDFDGDGIDDLRVRTAAGDLGAQLVKGEDDLTWQYYGSVGSEWSTSLASLL